MTTPTAPVKFPVICEEADIEPEILNAVLDVDRFVLVAKPDLSQLLTKDDRSIDGVHTAFTTPFTAILPDGIEPMRTFMAGAKIKEGISAKVFIVLDQQTSKVGKTCQVTTHDDDSDEDNYEFRVPIRCELTSALAAAQALEVSPDQCGHHTARALRNEAAITGGVWTQESAEIQHSYAGGRTARISVAQYPQSKDWDELSGTVRSEDARPYVPVFRTADINLEVFPPLLHFLRVYTLLVVILGITR
ncbi:hypothetical protein SLS63_011786 [Diaporthe eres]|uniref:Uncharacterized protein n=1 Tax=Diaporthe eres TaxID=83184 RepID=A0ABR1NT44_DIAER